MTRYPHLFQPLRSGRLSLRNRILFPAHQTLFSDAGVVGDRHRAYYVERAKGGVGAVVVEGGAVHPTTIKFPDYLRCYDPAIVPSLDVLAEQMHEHGAAVFLQLAHSGSRMVSLDSRAPLWAPSDVRSANSPEIPHAMTRADIAELVEGYVRSARNVADSGLDGVEVHAAHEYLLGEFLSPVNNRRTDAYGGPLENRARLLLEVVEAVRDAIGDDRVVGVRINGSDLRPGGNDTDTYVEVARLLDATGMVDYINVSAATSRDNQLIVPPMDVEQGVHVPHGARIHAAVDTPVFVVGRIKRPEHAEQIIAEGLADGVAVARALIADPEWPRKAAEGEPDRIRPCIGANDGCFGRLYRIRPISCVVNPAVGHEAELGLGTQQPTSGSRAVLVVGGGPAGLETARIAAERGHDVVLHEATDRLGGQLRLASQPAARRELWELVDFQIAALERLGVRVELGSPVDAATIADLSPDVVVVATGSRPRGDWIPCGDDVRPLTVPEAIELAATDVAGREVVVVDDVGHYPAYVPAELLVDAGARVALVTSRPVPGTTLDEATMARTLARLADKGVEFVTSSAPIRLDAQGLHVRHAWTGEQRVLAASAVVGAVGNVAEDGLATALVDAGTELEVHLVGDCLAPRTVLEAVREGHDVGRRL